MTLQISSKAIIVPAVFIFLVSKRRHTTLVLHAIAKFTVS
jgi:hypothetical protein